MKISLLTLTLAFSLSLCSSSFAYDQWRNGGCDSGSCQTSYCSECQCADPGYGRNTCMSNSEYCQVYGNIGALDR